MVPSLMVVFRLLRSNNWTLQKQINVIRFTIITQKTCNGFFNGFWPRKRVLGVFTEKKIKKIKYGLHNVSTKLSFFLTGDSQIAAVVLF